MARPWRSSPASSQPTRSSWLHRTRSPAAPPCESRPRRPGPGHEATSRGTGRARGAPARRLHGRPRLHEAVGAMTPTYKEADGWKAAEPSDHLPRGQWWAIFRDPELHTLEEQIAAANQNLRIAEARLREARAMVRFNRAALFPTISAGVGASSIRDSANRPFLSPNVNTGSSGDLLLSLDLSYDIDLWGRVRRTVAAARNEAQATAADLETARLSLQAELAMDYFELRAADAQKQLLDETVKAFEAALRLTTNRFQGGAAPKSDVAQAQTQLDTTRAQATDITVQRAQLQHAIATLIGKPPAAFSLSPRPLDTPPPHIPVGPPSQLLERRPAIAAAER